MGVDLRHGGNRVALAAQLGCRPSELLDASASLVPWTPWLGRLPLGAIRDYPDRSHAALRQAIATCHGLDPDLVLPGNGAAELFTWVAPRTTVYTLPYTYDGFLFIFTHDASQATPPRTPV